jgi:dipeptidyl aminopeptidase/acylaminoacyl peptidase
LAAELFNEFVENQLTPKELRADGKEIVLVVFENESHDEMKYENRMTCYNNVEDFFAAHLHP